MDEQIKSKEVELAAASTALEEKYGNLRRLQAELPRDAVRVQALLQELTALRSRFPAPQPATTQPEWWDSASAGAKRTGSMGDRGPRSS